MKSHLAVSAVGVDAPHAAGAAGSVPRASTALSSSGRTRTRPASSKPNLALASPNVWTHTLILTGELTRRSAHTLEAEIERLCEDGVTGITLDLRELTHIDSIGVAVIAFRSGLCKRRGYDFALIQGPRLVHRAFERAGIADYLPFQEVEEEAAVGAQAETQHA